MATDGVCSFRQVLARSSSTEQDVPVEPERIVRAIRETLGGAAFDIKFLGGYLNKPGDGDFHLLGVDNEMNRITLRCLGGPRVTIECPAEVEAHHGTVAIMRAAKVELIDGEKVLASLETGDEIVVRTPPTPDRRIRREAVTTPLAELVFVFLSPPNLRLEPPPGLRGAVLLDKPTGDDLRP